MLLWLLRQGLPIIASPILYTSKRRIFSLLSIYRSSVCSGPPSNPVRPSDGRQFSQHVQQSHWISGGFPPQSASRVVSKPNGALLRQISSGMVPVSKFSSSSSVCNLNRFPNSLGTCPVSMLSYIHIRTKERLKGKERKGKERKKRISVALKSSRKQKPSNDIPTTTYPYFLGFQVP